MSNQNGRSPTAIEVDGIVFDLNRISKRQYMKALKDIQALKEDDYDQALDLSNEVYGKVIISWPFDKPVTDYASLGVMDAKRVDDAYTELGKILGEKKSEQSSISQENTANP